MRVVLIDFFKKIGFSMCMQKDSHQENPENLAKAKKLLAKYGNFLRTIISLHVENVDDADDLYQEFFLFLIFNPLPKAVKNTKAYLSRMVVNRANDFFRRKKRHKQRIGRYSEIMKARAADDNPEENAYDKEVLEKCFDIINNNLLTHEAQALTLKYSNNLNNKEIAEKMKINSRSSSRYVSVGLKKLKKAIGFDTE